MHFLYDVCGYIVYIVIYIRPTGRCRLSIHRRVLHGHKMLKLMEDDYYFG